MIDFSDVSPQFYLLLLVALALGAFIMYLLLQNRPDLLSTPTSAGEQPSPDESPQDASETASLQQTIKDQEASNQALQDQVSTLKADMATLEEQLKTAQEAAANQAEPLAGGDDHEHESIQRLEKELAEAQATAAKSRAMTEEEAPVDKEAATMQRVKERASEVNFERIGTANADQKDDLKRIKGIGPFIEKKLNAIGIYTFAQIARFTPEDDEKVNEIIEFFPGRIRRDDWRGQAEQFQQAAEDAS